MIKVRLMHRSGRHHFEARWTDPLTGKLKTRSTGTDNYRAAEKFAARLEDKLNNEGPEFVDVTTAQFADVWQRYQDEVFPELSRKTRQKTTTAVNKFQEMVNPRLVASITTNLLQGWSAELRRKGLAGYTIKGYLSEIAKILRWADRIGIAGKAPRVELPRRLGGMKGRAPTAEEFDRMLAAVEGEVGAAQASSWKWLLRGLWLSGLRLDEAMRLSWSPDAGFGVDLSGKYPMFRIQVEGQKARRFDLTPMTSDFAEFLLAIPEPKRRGPVFDPMPLCQPFHVRLDSRWVGKIISRIGKAAKVSVAEKKFASAHDLRRAFGARWAVRVMPAVLQALMRHKSIVTTMQFYVGHNAQANAEAAFLAVTGNKTGNTGTHSPTPSPEPTHETA